MDSLSVGISLLAGFAAFGLISVVAGLWRTFDFIAMRQVCERMMRWTVRQRYAQQLGYANLHHWHVTDLWLLRMGLALALGGCGVVFGVHWVWLPLILIAGWLLVEVWLRQRIKQQQQLLSSQLPAFLDLLSMCLSAGMNLQTGVQLVLGTQGKTALANLWRTWLLQVRSGTGRVQAFKQMMQRVQSPALRRICVALIQAEQSGSGMATSLQTHSQQLRQERMMDAEKQALKAPVKMLLPLVVCFFPSTFLVLGFSIYINLGDLF